MADESDRPSGVVNTVLGPVPAGELGVVAVHESLLSIVPGAEYAYDVTINRAEIFDTLAGRLRAFQAAGGGTVVDATGMFHGRDVPLLESLARSTGVHIVASTGMGPEENLGGYFLTPQTNPPTPWPAEKFADLFGKEITEGMVVPRVERRGAAGLIVTAGSPEGMTPTDESLFRGAARAAIATGVPVAYQFGVDPLAELDLLLDEGIAPSRVVARGIDRREAAGSAVAIAERGANVALDHIGVIGSEDLSDTERAELVAHLVTAGHRDRVLLSAGAIGVAIGQPEDARPIESVLVDFAPLLISHGVSEADVRHLLTANPAALLAVKEA
ncbi:phosphotriesterase [Leucobacter sp. W1038]|uniref:phosphotriesterase family protein n=1 Tax=Leucobacter sp. W1038 TaxID=3438281 RepID=UPI003D98FBBA